MKLSLSTTKLAFLLFLILLGFSLAGQDYDVTPSGYSTCGHGNITSSTCTSQTWLGDVILFRKQSESTNDVEFRVRKCDFSDFIQGGTAYIKLGGVCGTIVGSRSFSAGEDDIRVFVDKNDLPSGTNSILATLNSNSSERFHTSSKTLTVSGTECPNFVITALSVSPSPVTLGGQFTVNFTVRNDGDGSGDPDQVDFFRSSNSSYGAGDAYLGRRSLDPLAPGQSVNESRTFTADTGDGFQVGGQYIIGWVDPDENEDECEEFDNRRFQFIQVVERPNLVVTNVTLDATQACEDGQISVSYTLRNIGNVSLTENFSVGFLASSNTTVSGNDTNLGTGSVSSNFSPGQSRTFSRNFTVPSNLVGSDWYLIVVADATSQVVESDEEDNALSSTEEFEFFEAPILLFPAANATLVGPEPELSWSTDFPLTSAVVVQSTSGNTVVSENTGSNDFYQVLPGVLQPGVEYVWQVAAQLNNGDVCFSEQWNFIGPCQDSYEPNDNPGNPNTGAFPNLGNDEENTLITSRLSRTGDQDNYGFTIQQSGDILINISSLPGNYELELWGPNGVLATSTNTGTADEEILYAYTGGAAPVYVKVYGKDGVFDCDDTYRLRVQWFPAGDGSDLALSTPIAPAPAPLVQCYPATITSEVINNGSGSWSGNLELRLAPVNDLADYATVRTYDNVNLVAEGRRTISFSTPDVMSVPGAYQLEVVYLTNGVGDGITVPAGTFSNPLPIGVAASPLRMTGPINVSPSPVVEGQPSDFSVELENRLADNFSGEVFLQLLDGSGTFQGDLASQLVTNLPAGATFTLERQAPMINEVPGNYQVRVQFDACDRNPDDFVDVRNNGFDNPRPFTIIEQPASLTVTAPNGGQTFTSNNPINITWTSVGAVGNISLELVDALGTTVEVIADNIANSGTHTFFIPACVLTGQYRIELYETANTSVSDLSNSTFTINGGGAGFECTCDIDMPSASNGDDPELVAAANYLCSEGIIQESGGDTRPYEFITRAELVKIVFIALFGNSDAKPSDSFDSPYLDLQNASAFFYRFAKALLYLEYDDGEAPFDRDLGMFRPFDLIAREDALKVILEAFDITETGFPVNPFSDVDNNTAGYDYIVTAADLCLVGGNSGTFRPRDNALRGEIFQIIYRLKQTCASGNVVVPSPEIDDYFCPINITTENSGRSVGLAEGSFSAYAENVFAIPGVKLPLGFGFRHDGFRTELPLDFQSLRPLGNGWSHTYNSYAIPYLGYAGDGVTVQSKIVIVWPGGQMQVYNDLGGSYPRTLTPETGGVYDITRLVSATVLEVKTKGQTTFRYNKMAVGNGRDAFLLTNIIERNGHTINIAYELGQGGAHRILFVARQLGNANTDRRTLDFSYRSGTNYLQSVSIRLPGQAGNEVLFNVNNDGDLKTFRDRRLNTTTYNYIRDVDANVTDEEYEQFKHLIYSIALPKGNTITNTYQKRKLMSMETNGELLTQVARDFNYNSATDGLSSTVTTANTNGGNPQVLDRVQVDFDPTTSMPKNVTTNGDLVEYEFLDGLNPYLPTHIVDGGLDVVIEYDPRGNPESVTETLTATNTIHLHQFIFDSFNNLRSYESPKGFTITNDFGSFQAEGLVQRVIDQEGYITTYDYWGAAAGAWKVGGAKTVTSPMGITLTYDYDGYGNPNRVTAPGDIEVNMNHDVFGRVGDYTNPNGYTWSYTYYANDILHKTTNPEQNDVENLLDDNNNVIGIRNEANVLTTLGYDPDTDLLVSKEFGGNTEQYAYYRDGRIRTITKPDGTVITITYVSSGNGIGQVASDGYATYTYDEENRVVTVTKLNGNETHRITYHYDALDRITSYDYTVTGGNSYGYSVGYEYDLNGNISRIKYPALNGGGTLDVVYTYYKNDWLKTVTDWEGKTTSYFYHPDGTLDYSTLPNGTRCTYEYDPTTRRMVGMTDTKSNGTVITNFDYILDDLGNITNETRTQPLEYGSLAPGTRTSTYAANNFTLTANGISQSLNANGNLTNDGEHTYSWDNYDMMTGRGDVSHLYDGHGMRRERRNAATGEATRYVLDVMGMGNVIAETNANGQPTAYYIHGAGLLYRKKPSGGGYNDSYYHYNFQGSTVAITDEAQNITHQYTYSPYGILWDKIEADENSFTFVGRYGVMRETDDFYFMRARFYDASKGRFISEDPVWSTNLYAYGGNNPVMNVDVNGELYIPVEFKQAMYSLQNSINFKIEQSKQNVTDAKYDLIVEAGGLTEGTLKRRVFDSYWTGSGDGVYELSEDEFSAITSTVSPPQMCVLSGNTVSVLTNFYATPYANPLGHATVMYDDQLNPIGLYDTYDFNINWPKKTHRSVSSEVKTILVNKFSPTQSKEVEIIFNEN